MKRLILLRHGVAESGGAVPDDLDRPLAPRGVTESGKIGSFLAAEGLVPDLALCSDAVRARQTWAIVHKAQDRVIETDFRDDLYLAEPATLLTAAVHVPADRETVIMIAHNPGLGSLADFLLANGGGDADAIANFDDNYPTGGLAVFESDIRDWRDFKDAPAYLTHFIRPRQL